MFEMHYIMYPTYVSVRTRELNRQKDYYHITLWRTKQRFQHISKRYGSSLSWCETLSVTKKRLLPYVYICIQYTEEEGYAHLPPLEQIREEINAHLSLSFSSVHYHLSTPFPRRDYSPSPSNLSQTSFSMGSVI